MTDRRFIEESFPVKEIGEISAIEKSIRQGHISTLHIWWARRPLAASRATIYAAMVPPPENIEEWQKQRDFIINLSKWENSNNTVLLNKARQDILQAHAERLSAELSIRVTVRDIEDGKYPRPRVLDPFGGGGSYPLESLRLGCETYASDYNPVAVLIEKASLEYPQKFGRPFEGMPDLDFIQSKDIKNQTHNGQTSFLDDETPIDSTPYNPLLEAVKYWGNRVFEEALKELAEFYPPDQDGNVPVGYIWARTIPCQNPTCGQNIPLMRQFWLAKKDNKKVALYPDILAGEIKFRIVGDGYDTWPDGFNPEVGTVSRAVVTCPLCGSVIDDKTTRSLFLANKADQRLVAVVFVARHGDGKIYRLATPLDISVFERAGAALQKKREQLLPEWGIEPIPDEPIPPKQSHRAVGSQLPLYNFVTWADLFNTRQKLTLITFANIVRCSHTEMLRNGVDEEFARAVTCYLALGVDRLADYGSQLCLWNYTGGRGVKGTFARQTLPMTWDYAESNPLNPYAASWRVACGKNEAWISQASLSSINPAKVSQASATSLPYLDSSLDAIFTDPPYYDNVPYSYLSDFFYVWLKRTIGQLYPELFSTPLAPKSSEIVAYSERDGGFENSKRFFEENLSMSFKELYRILKWEGQAVIVYAHKSTEGWETVINALLDSGLIVTGAWPMNTEKAGRLNAQETAALASSIYVVARKTHRKPSGFYTDVRHELRNHLDLKLHRLWEEGIGGADFFIAAIGSAIEVFGKYEQVIDYEGNVVRADRLLEEVRTLATDYAVRQILHNGFASEISPMVRLYVLWRWNYGEAQVPFDEGRKLALYY